MEYSGKDPEEAETGGTDKNNKSEKRESKIEGPAAERPDRFVALDWNITTAT